VSGSAARPAGPASAEPQVFEYAVLRVVPRVDRGEAINAGVLVYCRPLRYLGARVELDEVRLLALDPAADVAGVRRALATIAEICAEPAAAGQAGDRRAGEAALAGEAGQQDIGRRFRWLTAPRSTVVQPGPVHTGLTRDPAAEADRLLSTLVRRLDGPSR
jgi:Protein of unknown function (DUF3037)